ncbi:MAG TPA: murein L,D-transpeptidase catalytic domain family protein [Luteimonas sp.]|nr:murein L,D-transpeptidase catalytic domain family protein [Luteimonas sp.]HRO28213.1 murein L,D-transpeptidase catalytic domain family protein [Luteimonas sp.]HRP72199.1 murein L,D-transpeptidase catalytic domain family protein [Luteimonas sp.]
MKFRSVPLALLAAALATATPALARDSIATPPPEPLLERLAQAAPGLDRGVLSLATRAVSCTMRQSGAQARPATLSVIDFSRPSTEPRLWVFDLASQRLLFQELVAHGRNTGENMATKFSNRNGSNMSSIGVFRTAESYVGANGYSLRLDGLEPGFNDLARQRAIVIHGAPYVGPEFARAQGRLGRSLGCPAVRPSVARELIDRIRGGSVVFAYYPDDDWLQRSRLIDDDCGGTRHAGTSAAATGDS